MFELKNFSQYTHILLPRLLCHVHLGTEIGYWPFRHLQCHKWADRWWWLHDGWLVYNGALPQTFPPPADNSRRWKFDNHITFTKQELLNETTITRNVLRTMEMKGLVTNMGIRENCVQKILFVKSEGEKLFGSCTCKRVKGRFF
jgi:hypothetical protein